MAKANEKPKAKKTKLGNVFTKAWKSKDGKEVEKNDAVQSEDGKIKGVVTMRFTRPKDRAPMLMVLNEATGPARKGKGRQSKNTSVPAAEVKITKKGGKD